MLPPPPPPGSARRRCACAVAGCLAHAPQPRDNWDRPPPRERCHGRRRAAAGGRGRVGYDRVGPRTAYRGGHVGGDVRGRGRGGVEVLGRQQQRVEEVLGGVHEQLPLAAVVDRAPGHALPDVVQLRARARASAPLRRPAAGRGIDTRRRPRGRMWWFLATCNSATNHRMPAEGCAAVHSGRWRAAQRAPRARAAPASTGRPWCARPARS